MVTTAVPGLSWARELHVIAPHELPMVWGNLETKFLRLLERDPLESTMAELYVSLLLGKRILWGFEQKCWVITERCPRYVLIWGVVGKDLEQLYPPMLQAIGQYAAALGTPALRAWVRDGLVPFLEEREWHRIHTLMEVKLQ